MTKIRKHNSSLKLIMLIVVSLSVLVAVPAIPKSYAHAYVVYSDPAPSTSINTPPSQIEVDFVDPIDIRYSTINILDSNGKSVQNNDWHYISPDHEKTVVTLPPIPNGIYTVYTKVLDTTDGHTTTNAFVFAVGVPVPTNLLNAKTNVSFTDIVSIQDTLARYPSLVGQIIVVGAAFSSLWVWRPISKIPGLKNALESTHAKIDRNMTKIVLLGSILILGGDLGMIVSEAYSINAGLLEAISTGFGNTWLIRLTLSSALFVIALILYFEQKRTNAVLTKSQLFILLGIGIAVLATTTLISHAVASGKITPPIFDFVHNVVASLWIGSVIYLAFAFVPKLKELQNNHVGLSAISLAIPRFSTVFVALLGIVVITGPSLLYSLENNLSLTLASIYGEILIIKLSLAGAMIGIGAFNQKIIQKKAMDAISISPSKNNGISSNMHDTNDHGKSILSQFEKSMKVEALIGFVLIASIAFLVDSGTPGIQFQNELVQQQQWIPHVFAFTAPLNSLQNEFTETGITSTGDKIVLSVDPFYAGTNNVTISFLDQNNNPININSTNITLNQVDKGIGPLTVNDARQISPGVFSLNTAAFAISGHWLAQVEGITTQAGALNSVTTFDLYVKPNLNQLQANITEYKIPDKKALPLYPIYDTIRNVIWVGDSSINSGRIWEFNLNSKNYTEHKINGTNIVTASAIDSKNNIWYIDPITKILGYYEPNTGKDQKYSIPNNGTASGLAIDNSDNPWLTIANANQISKFDVLTKTFNAINLPTNSVPLGISIDQSSGQIWVAESGTGKIANIDPTQNYKISEYAPFNGTLVSPTAILYDRVTGKVFVSEHDGGAVSVFDPLVKTFQKYTVDSQALPFGLTFDANHDLWLAQHTLNKIAVIDPRTGNTNEFDIPSPSSFTQWITTDSSGDIILAEQRANAIGILTSSLRPGFVENTEQSTTLGIPLGFNYAGLVGPSMAIGLVAVAFIYSKSSIDLGDSIKQVKKNYDAK